MKYFFKKYQWKNWLYNEKIYWLKALWFAVLIILLAFLSTSKNFIWLVPPFSATLSILILLPKSPIAQPITVIAGSVLGASLGTLASIYFHGAISAAIVASIVIILLVLLKIYHPPAIALSMYPLLLNTKLLFPFVVVLPFVSVSVLSCWLMSRSFNRWGEYPISIHQQDGIFKG